MKYQVMPDLSPDDYNELKNDIAKRGVQVAVEYDEDGNILDGHHRVRACQELGITDWVKVVRVGMSENQKKEHARKLNMARRHLTRDQRQELIRQQLRDTPENSDRQIAVGLGVDHKTVGSQRERLATGGEIPHVNTSIGSDGKEYPRQVERKPITIYEPTPSTIEDAKELVQKASPELVQAVATGKIPLMQAHSVASSATPAQQTEAVKRVESGEADYLMEGYNQQKMEEYLNKSKDELQAEKEVMSEEARQEAIRHNIDKAFSTIYDRVLFMRSDYHNIARCLLFNPNRTQEDIVAKLNECIDHLQHVKAAVTKPSKNILKVVK